jgi:hypothetical protein
VGRCPQKVAAFVAVEDVDRVVPRTPAEELFYQLAAESQLALPDVTVAMEVLLRGMLSIEAESTHPSRREEIGAEVSGGEPA